LEVAADLGALWHEMDGASKVPPAAAVHYHTASAPIDRVDGPYVVRLADPEYLASGWLSTRSMLRLLKIWERKKMLSHDQVTAAALTKPPEYH